MLEGAVIPSPSLSLPAATYLPARLTASLRLRFRRLRPRALAGLVRPLFDELCFPVQPAIRQPFYHIPQECHGNVPMICDGFRTTKENIP